MTRTASRLLSIFATVAMLAGPSGAKAQDRAASDPPTISAPTLTQTPTATPSPPQTTVNPDLPRPDAVLPTQEPLATIPPARPAASAPTPKQRESTGQSDEAPAPPQATFEVPPKAASAHDQLPHELSPWGMFMAADVIVKTVMVSLAAASVLVWSVWLAKLAHIAFAKRRIRLRARQIEDAGSIGDVAILLGQGAARDPADVMTSAALAEIQRSDDAALAPDGIKERVASRLARIEAGAGRAMNAGTGLLATVGGTAPFVGLFGTVWGIMNSFIGISKAQTTNLAVVAPGIAEALLATAIGLVAAIPAVIFYNQLARATAGYRASLADAAAAVERLVSRDLDRIAARTSAPVVRAIDGGHRAAPHQGIAREVRGA